MMARLQLMLGRCAALALLLALFGGAVAAVALPYIGENRALQEENRELRHRLDGLAAVAATRSEVESQLALLEQDRAADDSLLAGESVALSGAALQERLTQIVASSGGRVSSSQMLPGEQASGFEQIMVRMQFEAGLPELHRVLEAVETSRPLLFVEALQIAVNRGQLKRVQSDKSVAIAMQVTLDLYGYRRQGAGQ